MYLLLWDTEFIRQQRAIEPQLERLERELQGVYALLKENPYCGELVDPARHIYQWSLGVYLRLLPLVLYYQIREEQQVVLMLRIAVDEELE